MVLVFVYIIALQLLRLSYVVLLPLTDNVVNVDTLLTIGILIDVTFAGIDNDVNFVFEKANYPIDTSVVGKDIAVRLVSQKAFIPIVVSALDSYIDVSPDLLNALLLIEVISLFSTIEVKVVF